MITILVECENTGNFDLPIVNYTKNIINSAASSGLDVFSTGKTLEICLERHLGPIMCITRFTKPHQRNVRSECKSVEYLYISTISDEIIYDKKYMLFKISKISAKSLKEMCLFQVSNITNTLQIPKMEIPTSLKLELLELKNV